MTTGSIIAIIAYIAFILVYSYYSFGKYKKNMEIFNKKMEEIKKNNGGTLSVSDAIILLNGTD